MLPPLSEHELALLPLIFGPTAALSADISDSFINTIVENEADLAEDTEAFPPMSRRAEALLADDGDAFDNTQPDDADTPWRLHPRPPRRPNARAGTRADARADSRAQAHAIVLTDAHVGALDDARARLPPLHPSLSHLHPFQRPDARAHTGTRAHAHAKARTHTRANPP